MGGACGRFAAPWVGHGAWLHVVGLEHHGLGMVHGSVGHRDSSVWHGLGAQHAQSVGCIGAGLRCTIRLEHHGLG